MTTARLFGTDGIRGRVNSEPMTAETALRVGAAAGRVFTRGPHRHCAVVGKDTRLSGYMIEPALMSGFVSAGMDVVLVGPMPTPAVAMLTRSLRADVGVMISASHNGFEDNGIKLFGPDGYKLCDETEAEIESLVRSGPGAHRAAPGALGRARRLDDVEGRYIEFVKNTFPRGLTLEGLRVVVDCANGAAYKVAPQALWELGAEVEPVGVEPDGVNINRGCGSTDTAAMQEEVLRRGAHIGIALDGDADRVLIADETGALVDGDQIMAAIALSWHRDGRLEGGGLVATEMSNLGLERTLGAAGIAVERAPVGDRHVAQHMRRRGFNVGGEQSGHVILADYATTGDGLIAALEILAIVARTGRAASEVGRVFAPVPQLLRSVGYGARCPLGDDAVQGAVRAGRARLGGDGRLLVRESGTEPLIRVMAEGCDEALVAEIVSDVAAAIERAA